MIEFEGMEDWDLQAVVRGCTSEFATAIMEDNNNSQCSSFDLLYGFSDCCFEKNKSVLDELDEFYKPFYPQAAIKEHPVAAGLSTVGATSIVGAAIPKRRKNQHKRVVKQVTADDLSSDTWAWRKYGQKPIKGSPYPRSYYRCSSSKGCLARKQVERSSSDPTMFTISYTAEHSHSHPVRRNSLAGIAKKKYNTMKKPSNSDPKTTPTIKDSSCCSPISSTYVFSPTSPLMACLEDEFPQHESNISMVSNNVLHLGFEGLDHGLTTADMSAFECWFSDQIPATFQS